MAKKLSMLMAAAAVLAFAVPAFASAATGLTMPEGTLVPTGKIITGTNIGEVTVTSAKLGNTECHDMMLEGALAVDTTSEVKVTEGGTSSATVCSRAGMEVRVFDVQLIEFKINGGGTGTFALAFKIELTGGVVCSFVGTSDAGTYTPGSDKIKVSEGALTVTPAACGTTAKLDGEFTLSTQGTSEPVFLM